MKGKLLQPKLKILENIERTLERQGFAGKTDIPKIVFLSAVSRFFHNPISLVVMGPSGSGKTYAIESGLQFIPKSAVESISGMSEKALPYLTGLSLKHRVLYLGEAAGVGDGQGWVFLRQLMTEGKLDYLTVQKTQAGFRGERLQTVEGPVSFMVATTSNNIHHEDQSRCIVLNIDEDHDRIAEGLVNMASGKTKSSVTLDLAPWDDLNSLISTNTKEVDISYASRLAKLLPTKNPKISRDFAKVLGMIKACALVHQVDRDRTDKGHIVADESDYMVVHHLLRKPLAHGLEATIKPGVKNVVDAVREAMKGRPYSEHGHEGISQSKIAENTGVERSIVLRNVHAAIKDGYLINKTPGQGREAHLVMGDRKMLDTDVLPSPKVLFANDSLVDVTTELAA